MIYIIYSIYITENYTKCDNLMSHYLKLIFILISFLIFISTTCVILYITNSFLSSKYYKSQLLSNKSITSKNYMIDIDKNNKDNMLTTKIQRVLPLPFMVYGTAWKKSRTKELVELAIKTGYRAIDTGDILHFIIIIIYSSI